MLTEAEIDFAAPVVPQRSGSVTGLPLESMFEKFSASHAEIVKPKIWSEFGPSEFYSDDEFTLPIQGAEQSTPVSGSVTVSPQELLTCSSSSSNSFSDLDYSPLFTDSADFHPQESSTWESLFGDDTSGAAEKQPSALQEHTVSREAGTIGDFASNSPEIKRESSVLSDCTDSSLESGKKRKRSYTKTAVPYNAKKDEFGITMYSRKPRSAPLAPIVVEEGDDSIDCKRAKNTEAARRSRARKMERMSQLEEKLRELARTNSALQDEVARLKAICGEI